MKTKEQVSDWFNSACIDRRDMHRLIDFFPVEEWHELGAELKEGLEPSDVDHTVKKWTRDNIIYCMDEDVEFGFQKALNKRGISSGLMYECVKMWLWILEDELYEMDQYAHYGLPLFKAVAEKYGFDNPIGDKAGNETEFASY